MGILRDTVARFQRRGREAVWQVETVTRVGVKLGVHRSLRWPGVQQLARELARGRLNTSTLFRYHGANDPDRIALVQAGLPGKKEPDAAEAGRLSYGGMDQLADRIAAALIHRGLGRGSAVLILLKNRIELFTVELGATRAGASAVMVSWRSTVPEIEFVARHAGVEAVFFDADVAELIREASKVLTEIPRRNLVSVGGAVAGFPSLEELVDTAHATPILARDNPTLLMYTSGTTGKPKGAVRKLESSALAAALAFIEQTPLHLHEVHLATTPLYHATAAGFCTMTFLLGGTLVVLADYRPETFLDAVERFRVTSTTMVPTMLHRLLEHGAEAVRAHDASSLHAVFCGGAPLSGSLALEAMDLLGDKVWNFYGATETGLVTLANPADLRAAPGTIGRTIPGNLVRLLDDHGRDVPEGEVGELYARSGMLVEGYHADPDATKHSMLGGFFSVGDLARRDREGRYHLEGRKRDMIISGGVNVYPAEVESALAMHPAVAEVAVVGVPDREWGERVRAFVTTRIGRTATADELRAHCRARLAGPKIPRDFVFLEALPKNPTGKILKRELETMAPS